MYVRCNGGDREMTQPDTSIVEEEYYVWSNEHRAWWGPGHMGYRDNLQYAGLYSKEEALKICNGANYGWTNEDNPLELPIPKSMAEALNPRRKRV